MCLGIPGQIIQVADSALQLAVVDVCGVKREVNISLICQDDPKPLVGKWVLVHVGFAMTIIDEEEAKRLQKKIQKNKFDFNDFLKQIEQIKKMGNLKDLASMIPGVGKAVKDLDIDDNAFKGVEAIIKSMTPKERTNPEIINTSRRQRIAKGSGTDIQEVNRLMKQFDQTRKMMKMVTGNGMANMMSRMKGMKMPGM